MKVKYNILIISLLVALSSCNMLGSIDDIKPENVLTDENAITDANSAEMECGGIYGVWRSFDFTLMRTAMLCLTGSLNNNNVIGGKEFLTNELKDDNEGIKKYYVILYNVINHATSLINNLKDASPTGLSKTRKAEILSEAYFNKAYAELMLLRSFGEFWDLNSSYGIVLYDEPVRDNIAKARSSVADSYTMILKDLEGASDAPDYAGISYHANKLSVQALKARVLLSMGNFTEAAQVADKVISEGETQGVMLEENYMDIFAQGFMSPELLFSLYASYPQQTVQSSVRQQYIQNGWNENNTITKIADELVGEENDGDLLTGEGYDSRFASVYVTTLQTNPFTGVTSRSYQMNKYQFGDNSNPSDTYYMMRLAEIYLIKAEANTRIGTPAALEAARKALKAITDRAGYKEDYVDGISNSDLLTMIFKHKYIELSGENYEEWFDMVRYHTWDGMDITPYVKSDHNLVMPIPREAMAGNNLLKQNPTYVSQSAE